MYDKRFYGEQNAVPERHELPEEEVREAELKVDLSNSVININQLMNQMRESEIFALDLQLELLEDLGIPREEIVEMQASLQKAFHEFGKAINVNIRHRLYQRF